MQRRRPTLSTRPRTPAGASARRGGRRRPRPSGRRSPAAGVTASEHGRATISSVGLDVPLGLQAGRPARPAGSGRSRSRPRADPIRSRSAAISRIPARISRSTASSLVARLEVELDPALELVEQPSGRSRSAPRSSLDHVVARRRRRRTASARQGRRPATRVEHRRCGRRGRAAPRADGRRDVADQRPRVPCRDQPDRRCRRPRHALGNSRVGAHHAVDVAAVVPRRGFTVGGSARIGDAPSLAAGAARTRGAPRRSSSSRAASPMSAFLRALDRPAGLASRRRPPGCR